jgi:type IV pilus assembly protein PilC
MDYAYLGYTADRKIVKGKITAVSESAASTTLSDLGYRVVNLKPVKSFLPNIRLFRSKVKSNELVSFSRQLALLLESGVGIIHCLELQRDQTSDAELRRVLNQIIPDLRSGSTLSEAMVKYPNVFSNIYSRMVEVGERTGSLDAVLKNLANYAETESKAISKLKNAMTYPMIVLVLGIVVATILVTFVLPPIINMFGSLGAELPLITKILIFGVNFVKDNILIIIGVVLGIVLLVSMYTRTKTGSLNWNRFKLKVPLLGRITHVSELARICRNMALLFRAGLPVNEIIGLTAQASGNKAISKELREVGEDALKGLGLSGPMTKRKSFLPLMTELISVGEETGNLEETLIMIALNYETEADIKTQRLLSLIEPTMTIIMGLMVGFLALSIFIPLYSSLQYIN